MSEAAERPSEGRRFPLAAAALSAGCVAAAAWVCARDCVCRHASPDDFWTRERPADPEFPAEFRIASDPDNRRPLPPGVRPNTALLGRYVEVRGRPGGRSEVDPRLVELAGKVWVRLPGPPPAAGPGCTGREAGFRGRVRWVDQRAGILFPELAVDTAAGRLTGASVASLVVGAAGVLLFAVAFRQWLACRKAAGPPEDGAAVVTRIHRMDRM